MGAAEEETVALEKVTAVFKTVKGKGWDDWEVLEMNVREHIGRPTYATLEIAATSQNFDFSPMLGKSCVLVLARGPNRKRFFKGIVCRIEKRGEYPFGSVARVDFASAIAAMAHGEDSRIFENMTAPQILEEVFKEALEPFGRTIRLNLTRKYAVREYCTQYKESDWNFVQRLMADEGITFYFDDGLTEAVRETAVLVDCNDSFPEIVTMGGEEAVLPPLESPEPERAWIAFQVVWEDTDEPVSRVALIVESSGSEGSARSRCETDSEGRARIETPLTRSDVRCSIQGLTAADCAVLADAGDAKHARAASAERTPRPTPKAIIRVEKRKVRTGETLESIAKDAGLTREELAYFNFGTKDTGEINKHLRTTVGCANAPVEGEELVFDDDDAPGLLLVPKEWRLEALPPMREHKLRVKPVPVLRPQKYRLRVRLPIDPQQAETCDDLFTLYSSGEEFRQTLSVSDDLVPGDQYVDLEYSGLVPGLTYSLEINPGQEGAPYLFFEDVPFAGLPAEEVLNGA